MNLLTRAGWVLCAAFFATLFSSLLHVDHAGVIPWLLLSAIAVLAFVRPGDALAVLAGVVPVIWYSASKIWNVQVGWAEALTCAVLTGLAADACRPRAARTPPVLGVPVLLLGAVTLASLLVSLRVLALRFGPDFSDTMLGQITREYFVDLRTIPGLHTALLLVEGVLLFAHAARLARIDAIARRIVAAAVTGAAVAALCTVDRLAESAARSDRFWSALVDLATRLRWNVHYADTNAAGSYYALVLPIAVGLAWTAGRRARVVWMACGVAIAAGLWLTSSRMAMLAVPAAAAGVLLIAQAGTRRFLLRAAAIGVAALALVVVLGVLLPQRGLQKSSTVAADVRLGMLEAGLRMIRSHPVFGLGLGQFYERSGEFISPELFAAFPVALHENAHNNFVQIAAELGLTGGMAFAWAIVAVIALATGAVAQRSDRFLQCLFAGVLGFVLTCLGGHPLLIPEAAYSFWLLAGLAGGLSVAARPAIAAPARRVMSWRPALVAALAVLAVTLPWRMHEDAQAADLEHVAIGVTSVWRLSPDGIRYREAEGRATLFIPADGCKFSVNPRTDAPVQLELRLGGRVVNVVSLAPGHWNDLVVPSRNQRDGARFVRLELRVLEGTQTVIWITKDQPL